MELAYLHQRLPLTMDSLRFLSASPFSDVPDRSSHRLKLNQFHVDAKDVQIKRIIGRGEQGVVFSAEIEGQIYALKVVRIVFCYWSLFTHSNTF